MIEEFQLSFVNDQLALIQFDEGVVIQEAEESLLVPGEKFQQFIVVNVAGSDEEQLGRALAKFVGDFEIGVLGNQHALVLVRQVQEKWIWRAVFSSEIQGVNYVVPALLKPERESARQLGIDQEPHAAKGTMR